jgi:hypothetical protein
MHFCSARHRRVIFLSHDFNVMMIDHNIHLLADFGMRKASRAILAICLILKNLSSSKSQNQLRSTSRHLSQSLVLGRCRSNLFSLPFSTQQMPREHKVVSCCYRRSFAKLFGGDQDALSEEEHAAHAPAVNVYMYR